MLLQQDTTALAPNPIGAEPVVTCPLPQGGDGTAAFGSLTFLLPGPFPLPPPSPHPTLIAPYPTRPRIRRELAESKDSNRAKGSGGMVTKI